MADLFDEIIVCSNCGKKMSKVAIEKNGFRMRAFQCERCNKRIYHPQDIEEYKRFQELRQRPFAVKLRMVGNSYTVSIPREIIDLEKNMHKEMERQMEHMTKIVRLMLEEPGRLSLFFNTEEQEAKEKEAE